MLFLILLLTANLHAQTPPQQSGAPGLPLAPTNERVEIRVSASNLQFGKPFSVTYKAPDPITQILEVDTNTQENGRTVLALGQKSGASFTIEASAYSAVPYPFPSLRVTALDGAGSTNIFYTPSFQVGVSNASGTNQVQLADIVPPPFVWNHLWTILLALLALAIVLIIILARRKKAATPRPVAAEDPFHVLSRRLKALDTRRDALDEGNYKEFFVELSETVRELFSLTVAPLALESTTKEILDLLKAHGVSQKNRESARFILHTCDAAKYAKAVFPAERTGEAMEAAFFLLRRIPRPSGPEGRGADSDGPRGETEPSNGSLPGPGTASKGDSSPKGP